MKFFVDTASLAAIREVSSLGLLDGVTTNPTLLSKEEGDPEEILREITKIVSGPVSAEVVALDAARERPRRRRGRERPRRPRRPSARPRLFRGRP